MVSPPGRLSRAYRIRGLDRVLYDRPPAWTEGTFEQTDEYEGVLRLHVDGLAAPNEVSPALERMDLLAERFRLAIAHRTGCPLVMSIAGTRIPTFDVAGVVSITDTLVLSDSVETSVNPKAPPSDIEQIHAGAARWIQTLTEARRMSAYPDEVLKRLYLVIEELKDVHASALSPADIAALEELALVRDFVSHPVCDRKKVPPFIQSRLPSAVVSVGPPLVVRYDRTDVEHRNFVGRYDPIARRLAHQLLQRAIAALP